LKAANVRGSWGRECDIVIGEDLIFRADAAYLDLEGKARQQAAAIARGKTDTKRQRVYVPPTLVIEAVSPGHERHDRVTKRQRYGASGVKNYWLLDDVGSSLECLVLDGAEYQLDCSGKGRDEMRPAMFPGLTLPLNEVWAE
jgi:Uma2 family endonuclease